MAHYEHEVRGIPLWLLREYLEELGGRVNGDHVVAGEGWQAQISQIDDFRLGSLRVGQVRLELTGEPDAVARIEAALQPKLLRAGG